MKRGWFLLLAISLGLNAGLLVMTLAGSRQAETALQRPFLMPRGPHGRPGGPLGMEPKDFAEHRLRRLSRTLKLTEDQRTHLADIMKENMGRIGEEREHVQKARLALREACRTPDPDPVQVRSLVRNINNSQARLDSLVAESMLREANVLTPEQRVRYFEAVPWEAGRGAGRPMMRGHRRGGAEGAKAGVEGEPVR